MFVGETALLAGVPAYLRQVLDQYNQRCSAKNGKKEPCSLSAADISHMLGLPVQYLTAQDPVPQKTLDTWSITAPVVAPMVEAALRAVDHVSEDEEAGAFRVDCAAVAGLNPTDPRSVALMDLGLYLDNLGTPADIQACLASALGQSQGATKQEDPITVQAFTDWSCSTRTETLDGALDGGIVLSIQSDMMGLSYGNRENTTWACVCSNPSECAANCPEVPLRPTLLDEVCGYAGADPSAMSACAPGLTCLPSSTADGAPMTCQFVPDAVLRYEHIQDLRKEEQEMLQKKNDIQEEIKKKEMLMMGTHPEQEKDIKELKEEENEINQKLLAIQKEIEEETLMAGPPTGS